MIQQCICQAWGQPTLELKMGYSFTSEVKQILKERNNISCSTYVNADGQKWKARLGP